MDLFINILLRQFKIVTNVIASEKCFLNNENTRSIKKSPHQNTDLGLDIFYRSIWYARSF